MSLRRPFFFLLLDSWLESADCDGAVVVPLAGCAELELLESPLPADGVGSGVVLEAAGGGSAVLAAG